MLHRRAFIASGAAALAAPAITFAATNAARRFRVLRDGSDIGVHTISVSRDGADVQVAIDIELKVKILGITAYRYEMSNRETWRDGMLISMVSQSNDDGDEEHERHREPDPTGDREQRRPRRAWQPDLPGIHHRRRLAHEPRL